MPQVAVGVTGGRACSQAVDITSSCCCGCDGCCWDSQLDGNTVQYGNTLQCKGNGAVHVVAYPCGGLLHVSRPNNVLF